MTRLTNFLAALAPWCAVALAPIATAWQIYAALIAWLAFPPWVAFSAALALELLGMTAISLALTLRSYNATKRKDDPTAPMALPYVIIGGDFIVAELLTVALDPTLNRWTLARAVFPPFSLVAFGLAATMQDHAARLAGIADAKAQKKVARAQRKQDSILAKQQAEQPALDTRGKVLAFYRNSPHGTFTEAASEAGVSRQRVAQIVKVLESEGVINRNGKVTVTE